MNIQLTITFLIKEYEDRAIANFVKAGFIVGKTKISSNISDIKDAASYITQLDLSNDAATSKQETDKVFIQIKTILSSTKYYSVVFYNGSYNGLMPTNINITRKPKVKREVPYLKMLDTKQEEKTEN